MPFPTPNPRHQELGWVGREVMELQKKQGERLRGKTVISSKCFFVLDSSLLYFLKLLLVEIEHRRYKSTRSLTL